MNLRATLEAGKQLQARADSGETAPPATDDDKLARQLDNGLRWLVAHYEFSTKAEQEKWERARGQWLTMADDLDARLGLPLHYTRDELDLVFAWLRGDAESPQVYYTQDGLTGGNVWLDGAGRCFRLPVKLRLPEGTVVECRTTKRPTDGPQVYGVMDLLLLFRVKRVFPGSRAVG